MGGDLGRIAGAPVQDTLDRADGRAPEVGLLGAVHVGDAECRLMSSAMASRPSSRGRSKSSTILSERGERSGTAHVAQKEYLSPRSRVSGPGESARRGRRTMDAKAGTAITRAGPWSPTCPRSTDHGAPREDGLPALSDVLGAVEGTLPEAVAHILVGARRGGRRRSDAPPWKGRERQPACTCPGSTRRTP